MNTELKTLQDFLDEVASEIGIKGTSFYFKSWDHYLKFGSFAPDKMTEAAERYGKYCYEQGLKADRWKLIKHKRPSHMEHVFFVNKEGEIRPGYCWSPNSQKPSFLFYHQGIAEEDEEYAEGIIAWHSYPDTPNIHELLSLPPLPGTQTT